MGANTFTIQDAGRKTRSRVNRVKDNPKIKYNEAIEFKNRFDFPSTTSISYSATGTATVNYLSKETNPNISILGIDEIINEIKILKDLEISKKKTISNKFILKNHPKINNTENKKLVLNALREKKK